MWCGRDVFVWCGVCGVLCGVDGRGVRECWCGVGRGVRGGKWRREKEELARE